MDKQRFYNRAGIQYFRFLVSYILILFIPLIVFSFYFQSRFMIKFYDEVYETIDMELQQISIQVDEKISQMEEDTSRFAIEKIFYSAKKAQNPYQFLPVINYLSILTSANEYYDDIFLNLYDSEYMITSSTTHRKDLFYSYNFKSKKNFAMSVFDAKDASGKWPHVITSQDLNYIYEDYVFYILPLYSDLSKQEGTLIFKINKKSFQTLISNRLISYQTEISIISPSNLLIYTNKNSLPNQKKENNYTERMYISNNSGWYYSAIFPNSQETFTQIRNISKEYIIVIVFTFFLSILAILLLNHFNYKPIKNLSKRARHLVPENMTNNEFKEISNAMDLLSDKNENLESTLAINMLAIKNARLHLLLNGAYQSIDDFNLDNNDFGLYLKFPQITVITSLIENEETDNNQYAEHIKQSFPNNLFYFCTLGTNQKQIIFLVNSKENTEVFELAGNMLKLSKSENVLLTLGIGSTTSDFEKISQSFIEASSALDYRYIKGNNTIIDFQEISKIDKHRIYPNSEIISLSNALASHNVKNIESSLNNIVDILKAGDLPIYLARCICSDVLHLINKYRVNERNEKKDIISLSRIETVQDVIATIQEWKTLSNSTRKNDSSMKDIMNYIDGNCLKCEFSAYETADRFDMALPVLSKAFKEYSGKNLIDYTTEKRMETAKYLLLNTSLSISEISEKVGYYNLSSFTRRFKQSQGINPTEYRSIKE